VNALRRHAGETAIVIATSVAALAVLRLVDTQIFTEPWAIDPWLYTALMTNFDTTYAWFNGTYYASRLPAIIPGLFLNSLLTPVQAYVVLHLALFFAGGIFLYLLVRSLFGVRPALFVYPAVLTNAAFVDAHTWDYFDGFVITYLAGGLYFLVSSIGTTSRVRPTLAGFFFAAAAATNLFATLLVFGAVVAYFYGRARVEGRLAVKALALDVAWFVVGAGILVGACGAFAREHGGRILFFMPSIEAAKSIDTATYKLPTYDWMWAEPRLLIPLFVAAAAALAWPYRRRSTRDPAGIALTAVGLGIFLMLVVWEFTRSGTFLQLQYYYDTLYPFMFVALAAAVFSLFGSTGPERRLPSFALAGLGLALGAAPLIAVYVVEQAHLWGRRGSALDLVLLTAAVAAAAALRLSRTRHFAVAVAPFAAALIVVGVNFASAASATTHVKFETHHSSLADARDVFSIGMQFEEFMHAKGLEESLPAFWYDESADPALTGIQSLYYYAYTFLSREMPKIDEAFRTFMESREPEHVVLLCVEPTCSDGANVMRRAGYHPHEVASAKLSSGSKSIWVQAYAMR
jgi:hypothetical protein